MIITHCSGCHTDYPAFILRLQNPEKYEKNPAPDSRTYRMICLQCGNSLHEFIVDNTISAIKQLRDKLNKLYGEPMILPLGIWI